MKQELGSSAAVPTHTVELITAEFLALTNRVGKIELPLRDTGCYRRNDDCKTLRSKESLSVASTEFIILV